MSEKELETLMSMLEKLYHENAKTCDYDCYNCSWGVLETPYDAKGCSIEVVISNIVSELEKL